MDREPVVLLSFYDLGIGMGVRSLCAYLKSRGQPAKILHFGLTEPFKDLAMLRLLQPRGFADTGYITPPTPELLAEAVELAAAQNPLLVGLSVDSRMVPLARRFTELFAERLPNVPVVWGGIHPTLDALHALQFARTVCVGEGEKPLLAMAEAIRGGERDFSRVPGLSGRTPDGREFFNGPAPLLDSLDDIPPMSLMPEDHLYVPRDTPERMMATKDSEGGYSCKAYSLMASRGCVFSCTYCYAQPVRDMMGAQGAKFVRRRSMDHLFEELRHAKSLPWVVFFSFWDDIFVDDRQWLEQFAERYPAEIGIPFFAYVHPNTTNKKVVELLAKAGCHTVGIGIQSGSQRIARDLYDRQYSRERAIEAANLLNSRFDTYYDLIINNPYETEEDARETLELFLEFPHPFGIGTNSLLWFPGQAITNKALADGVIKSDDVMGREGWEGFGDVQFRSGPCGHQLPPRLRSLYLLTCATQHRRVDRDLIRAWSRDDAMLNDPPELERRLLELYYDQAEKEIVDLRGETVRMRAEIAGLRQALEGARRQTGTPSGNGAAPAATSRGVALAGHLDATRSKRC
jgi:anaerobic magnesium-protoporphyrin IX monomethyl ester cyclase